MTNWKAKTGLILISLLISLLWATVAFAQASPITAEVDKTSLSTDETLNLSVRVAGSANLPDPILPALDGIFVLDKNTSSKISIVDGLTVTEFVHTYKLQPTRVGTVTIGAVSISVANQTFSASPIDIQVTAGSVVAQPTPSPSTSAPVSPKLVGQDFFVEANVDNISPYFGEQVVHTFRFYRAIEPSGQLVYHGPTFSGFWNPQQPVQRQFDAEAAGRSYKVLELQTVLFPTLAGEGGIGATSLTIEGTPPQTLDTEAITLKISPLPSNTPGDFSGAVGQFGINAVAEPATSGTGEPVTLRVSITGKGNFETLAEPVISDIPGLRALDSATQTESQFDNGDLTGHRTFERLLVPEADGNYSVPPISYTFFDPDEQRFRTVSSEFVNFTVGEGGNVPSRGPGSLTGENVVPDILTIKRAPASLSLDRRPVTSLALFWAAWVLPLIFLSAALAWRIRRIGGQDINAINRNLNVHRDARRMIGRARRSNEDHFTASGRILTAYVARKLNKPTRGMTDEDVVGLLKERQISIGLLERVESTLDISAGGRYAPGSEVNWFGEKVLSDLETVIDDLEKELGV